MNWVPKGLGAEPKKLGLLIAIVVLGGGYAYWSNSGSSAPAGAVKSGPTGTVAPAPVATTPPTNGVRAVVPTGTVDPVAAAAAKRVSTVPRTMGGVRAGDDFRPTFKLPEGFDISTVDPTLKLDLLARIRNIGDAGGRRSLFEFYNPPPPPPKVEAIKPLPPPPPVVSQTKSTTPVKATPPPPPPIPLKFYGFLGAQRDSRRRGLFIDGEEIFQVAENDLIRNRYKIVRLGITSAEVEDTVGKNKQTLPLLDPCESNPGACDRR